MPFQASPMIVAQDLLQANLGAMTLEELQEHANSVRDVLLALLGVLFKGAHLSATAAADVRRLIQRVQAHLSAVLALIEDRKLAEAGEPEPAQPPPKPQR